MNIIEINNLIKRYKKEEVLNINTFSFLFGKSYLIYGENGSGKSTLLKLIVGLIKPTNGIIIKNTNYISYVPERLIFPDFLRVNQFLDNVCKVNRIDGREGKIEELCSKWKVDKNKKIYELSKGMRQKVLIMQSFLIDAPLYIFDEVLNGLDIQSQNMLIEEIKKLTSKGKTVLIATHFDRYFSDVCDVKVLIDKGKLIIDYEKKAS